MEKTILRYLMREDIVTRNLDSNILEGLTKLLQLVKMELSTVFPRVKSLCTWDRFVVELEKTSIFVVFKNTIDSFEVFFREGQEDLARILINRHFELDCDRYQWVPTVANCTVRKLQF